MVRLALAATLAPRAAEVVGAAAVAVAVVAAKLDSCCHQRPTRSDPKQRWSTGADGPAKTASA